MSTPQNTDLLPITRGSTTHKVSFGDLARAAAPAATTAASGLVQLADAAAITAGTAGRVVDAAQLKAVSDADDWTRTGTEISPKTAGDSVFTSGAVKVGGTTAAPNLQIKGDGGIVANTNGLVYDAATKRLGLGSSSAPGGSDARMWIDQSSVNDYGLLIGSSGGTKIPTLWFRDASAVNNGRIVGQEGLTLATGNSATSALTIDGSQRVGIGTTAPTNALTIRASADDGIALTRPSNPANTHLLISTTEGGGDAYSVKYETNNNDQIFSTSTGGRTGGNIIFRTSTSVPSVERGRWDNEGRFLVGTSTDSGGALLQVNGDRVRIATAKTPASATAAGVAGEICWDASYVYVCVAANTWKRSAIATW
jgi:hypothetical protein